MASANVITAQYPDPEKNQTTEIKSLYGIYNYTIPKDATSVECPFTLSSGSLTASKVEDTSVVQCSGDTINLKQVTTRTHFTIKYTSNGRECSLPFGVFL